jgi:putative SOS response-associated peptidase YedK
MLLAMADHTNQKHVAVGYLCKSISIVADAGELTDRFQIDSVLFHTSNRYEILPTQSVSAILVRGSRRQLDEFRWGLMPFWAKDSVWMDSRAITEKRIFQRIAKKQRCVIPCSGFYVTNSKKKHKDQWFKMTMRTGTFGIAGLFDVWTSASGEELRTCTMLMTAANSLVAPYEGRMPCIMESHEMDRWLEPELSDPFMLQTLLRPVDEGRMRCYSLVSAQDKYETDENLKVFNPELA